MVGTLEYMPPETLRGAEIATSAADVYAWAIITNQLITNVYPYTDSVKHTPDEHTMLNTNYDQQDILKGVVSGTLRPTLPTTAPQPYMDLIQSAWAGNPTARPPMNTIINALEQIINTLHTWPLPPQTQTTPPWPTPPTTHTNSPTADNMATHPTPPREAGGVEAPPPPSSCEDNDEVYQDALESCDGSDVSEDLDADCVHVAQSLPEAGVVLGSDSVQFNAGGFASAGRRGTDRMEDRHVIFQVTLAPPRPGQRRKVTHFSVSGGSRGGGGGEATASTARGVNSERAKRARNAPDTSPHAPNTPPKSGSSPCPPSTPNSSVDTPLGGKSKSSLSKWLPSGSWFSGGGGKKRAGGSGMSAQVRGLFRAEPGAGEGGEDDDVMHDTSVAEEAEGGVGEGEVVLKVAAIFDGHRGPETASFASKTLPSRLMDAARYLPGGIISNEWLSEWGSELMLNLDKEFCDLWVSKLLESAQQAPHAPPKPTYPGCTALVVIQVIGGGAGGRIMTLNVGDCRAVLLRDVSGNTTNSAAECSTPATQCSTPATGPSTPRISSRHGQDTSATLDTSTTRGSPTTQGRAGSAPAPSTPSGDRNYPVSTPAGDGQANGNPQPNGQPNGHTQTQTPRLLPIQLTTDHTASLPSERRRITRGGGSVQLYFRQYRVFPGGLQITRSLGDVDMKTPAPAGVSFTPEGGLRLVQGKQAGGGQGEGGSVATPTKGGGGAGIVSTPEVRVFDITSADLAIVAASDGCWDKISNDDVASILGSTVREAGMISKRFVVEALQRGSTDNITVVTILLQEQGNVTVYKEQDK